MSYEDIESSMENVRSKVDAINLRRWRDFLSAQCHAQLALNGGDSSAVAKPATMRRGRMRMFSPPGAETDTAWFN